MMVVFRDLRVRNKPVSIDHDLFSIDDNKVDRNVLVVDIHSMDNKHSYFDSYPMCMHILYVCLLQSIDQLFHWEYHQLFVAEIVQ